MAVKTFKHASEVEFLLSGEVTWYDKHDRDVERRRVLKGDRFVLRVEKDQDCPGAYRLIDEDGSYVVMDVAAFKLV